MKEIENLMKIINGLINGTANVVHEYGETMVEVPTYDGKIVFSFDIYNHTEWMIEQLNTDGRLVLQQFSNGTSLEYERNEKGNCVNIRTYFL